MIYLYDQALQLPTVQLYDTLLMAMALNAAKDMYDRGELQIKDFLKAYGDFLTPITADLDWWNLNVTGRVRDTINQMYARGGDPLRNALDRALLSMLINNMPYGEIAKMKSSAENVKDYLKNKAELQAKGLWNPDMEAYAMGGKSLENWDTLKDGAWTRTSPIMYKSMDDIIEPIVSKLEPTFDAEMTAAKNDGFDYSTVSRQRILDTINDSMLDLIGAGTAEGYYYSKALEAAGNDPNKAKALLRDWYANRASNHVRTLREANQFRLDDHRTANDIRTHAANAATDYRYDILGKYDLNLNGKIDPDERYVAESYLSKSSGKGLKDKEYPNIFREAEAYTPGVFNKAHPYRGITTGTHVGYVPSNQYNLLIDPVITANNIKLKNKESGEIKEAYQFDAADILDNVYTIDQNGKVTSSRIINNSGSNKFNFIPNGSLRAAKYGTNGYEYYISGEMRGNNGGMTSTEDGSTEIWIKVKERAWNHGTQKK